MNENGMHPLWCIPFFTNMLFCESVYPVLVRILLLIEIDSFAPRLAFQREHLMRISSFHPFGLQSFHYLRLFLRKVLCLERVVLQVH